MGALGPSTVPSSRTFVKISIALGILLSLVLWKSPQIHRYYRPQQYVPTIPQAATGGTDDYLDYVSSMVGTTNEASPAYTEPDVGLDPGLTSSVSTAEDNISQKPSFTPVDTPWPSTANSSPSGKTYTKAMIAGTVKKYFHKLAYLPATYPDWDLKIYIIDDQEKSLTGFGTPQNQGREAGVYISYIVDHYHDLPDIMVFTHGQRYQWHSDDPMYDTVPTVQYLNLDYVSEVGYTSLRCAHWPGCPAWLEPSLEVEDPECWHPGCEAVPTEKFNTTTVEFPRIERAYADLFHYFFPDQPIPTEVGAPCCAQFAVSREQVLKQPLAKYLQIQEWIMHPDNNDKSFKVGAIMEHIWHVLFGRDAVYCEDAEECYCKKYGLCDLSCPSEEECEGRWFRITKGSMDLPKDWPPVEGQYYQGLPYPGWWNDEDAVANNTYSGPNAHEFVIVPVVKDADSAYPASLLPAEDPLAAELASMEHLSAAQPAAG